MVTVVGWLVNLTASKTAFRAAKPLSKLASGLIHLMSSPWVFARDATMQRDGARELFTVNRVCDAAASYMEDRNSAQLWLGEPVRPGKCHHVPQIPCRGVCST